MKPADSKSWKTVKLDELIAGPEAIQKELDELKHEETELLVRLQECRVKIDVAKAKPDDLPQGD